MKSTPIAVVAALCSLTSLASAGGASYIQHEGVVSVYGERFTGEGALRLALVDPETDSYLWTNDGSAVTDPDPPINPVVLQVVNGVYNVDLGDATVTNMTAVPMAIFSENANVVLRVWFDDLQGNGVHVLSPDLKITTSPYSVQARTAVQLNIPDTDTAAVFVDGTGNVGIGLTDPSARLDVDGTTELNGDVTINSDLTVDTNTLVVNGTAGNVGIGTTAPEAKLEIAGGDENGVAIISGFDASTLFLKREGSGFDSALSNQAGVAPFVFYGGAATGSTDPNTLPELMRVTSTGALGIGSTVPSAKLDVVGTTELNGDVDVAGVLAVNGDVNVDSGHDLVVDGTTLFVDASNNRVGVGTTSPGNTLDVAGSTELNGPVTVYGNVTINDGVTTDLSIDATGDAILTLQSDTNDNGNFDSPRLFMRQGPSKFGLLEVFRIGGQDIFQIRSSPGVDIEIDSGGGNVAIEGLLHLDVDSSEMPSGEDHGPEVYLVPGQGCSAENRGAIFVGRVSAASADDQDCLCVCMLNSGVYEWTCFNP